MPSMDGGTSSSREYAPHMYILSQGGNPDNDADYAFVGNAVVTAVDWETKTAYNVGVTVMGEVVCDTMIGYLTNDWVKSGISFEDIPESLKPEMIDEGLSQVGTFSGQILLRGLGVRVPDDIEPMNFDKWTNGSPQEQVIEESKRQQWRIIEEQLRDSLEAE